MRCKRAAVAGRPKSDTVWPVRHISIAPWHPWHPWRRLRSSLCFSAVCNFWADLGTSAAWSRPGCVERKNMIYMSLVVPARSLVLPVRPLPTKARKDDRHGFFMGA